MTPILAIVAPNASAPIAATATSEQPGATAAAFLALLGTPFAGVAPAVPHGTGIEASAGHVAAPAVTAAQSAAGSADAPADEREAMADPTAGATVTAVATTLPAVAVPFVPSDARRADGALPGTVEAAPADTQVPAPRPSFATPSSPASDPADLAPPFSTAIGSGAPARPSPDAPGQSAVEPAPVPAAAASPVAAAAVPALAPRPSPAPRARLGEPNTATAAGLEPAGPPPTPSPASVRDAKAAELAPTRANAEPALAGRPGQGPNPSAAPPAGALAMTHDSDPNVVVGIEGRPGFAAPTSLADVAGPNRHSVGAAAMRAVLVSEQAADGLAATDPGDADGAAAPIPALAQTPPRAAAANAAPSTQAPDSAVPQRSAERIAVAIHQAMRDGVDRIRVRLWPAELGHVELTLHVGRDHRTTVNVAAERPETLELLQRDARGLERALADAGLKLDAGNLAFNLRHGQGFDHAMHRQRAPEGDAPAPIVATVTDASPPTRHSDPSRLVDLHA